MKEMPEKEVPFGSQQAIDLLNLAYHYKIAERLLADPDAVLACARSNLRRWIKVHEGSSTVYALLEWQELLDTLTIAELVAVITEDSDEGQRLRQSTPFAGVLSEQERLEIFTRYEKGAFV